MPSSFGPKAELFTFLPKLNFKTVFFYPKCYQQFETFRSTMIKFLPGVKPSERINFMIFSSSSPDISQIHIGVGVEIIWSLLEKLPHSPHMSSLKTENFGRNTNVANMFFFYFKKNSLSR